jgi:hypothetical protein
MICCNYFQPLRSQGGNYKKNSVYAFCGEKITNWPTKTLGHIKMIIDE